MGNITYLEYKRRVFNTALLECFSRIHREALSGSTTLDENVSRAASDACKAFFNEELNLANSTITATKRRLSEAVQFIQDCVETSENIACDKADCAKKEGMVIPDEQEAQLSAEDKSVITQLFDGKDPKLQVDQIRDATVQALLAEDKKAEEIRDAVDVAKAQSAEEGTNEALEETVKRLDRRGPTSLMHAIMNNVSRRVVKTVNETSGNFAIGEIMASNSDAIKDQAIMIYQLYEMANVFAIKKYTPADVMNLARDIYNEK